MSFWTQGLKPKPRERTKRLTERRPTAQEHADAQPLADFLESVERLGVASEGYRRGYADGFDGCPVAGKWQPDYKRGVVNGEAARKRGAHQ